MKPSEMSKTFTEYLGEGTSPKGIKIQSFFNHLGDRDKKVVFNNIAKAFSSFEADAQKRNELEKKNKKEISEWKKRGKELGMSV